MKERPLNPEDDRDWLSWEDLERDAEEADRKYDEMRDREMEKRNATD